MLVSVTRAAEELDLSAETIRRNIRSGRWPAIRLGPKSTRLDLDEIRALAKPFETKQQSGARTSGTGQRIGSATVNSHEMRDDVTDSCRVRPT